MSDDLLRAIALVLVIEGMLPFASPSVWRQAMRQAGELPDHVLRTIGIISMLGGLLILYLMH
jgi:uncharacterized protein